MHQIQYDQYADDLMLYTTLTLTVFSDLSSIAECTDAVSTWFMENSLLLTSGKTDAVIFGIHQRLESVDSVNVAGSIVQFSDALKLLDVMLDSTLSFDKHVSHVERRPRLQLRHIRPLLTLEATQAVAVCVHHWESARLFQQPALWNY